ncbi:MAG: hypothetical protein U1F77_10795 [Kiritimatiellia bacterium]
MFTEDIDLFGLPVYTTKDGLATPTPHACAITTSAASSLRS